MRVRRSQLRSPFATRTESGSTLISGRWNRRPRGPATGGLTRKPSAHSPPRRDVRHLDTLSRQPVPDGAQTQTLAPQRPHASDGSLLSGFRHQPGPLCHAASQTAQNRPETAPACADPSSPQPQIPGSRARCTYRDRFRCASALCFFTPHTIEHIRVWFSPGVAEVVSTTLPT